MQAVKALLSRLSTGGELLAFLWQRRLWWMVPMVLLLLVFGLLLALAQGSAVMPFVYTLF